MQSEIKAMRGVVGLNADFDGRIIGKGFSPDMTETTISGYYAAGGAGDKKLVYRTDVITAYPSIRCLTARSTSVFHTNIF